MGEGAIARNEDLRRLLSLAGVCQQEEQVKQASILSPDWGPMGPFFSCPSKTL